MLTKVLSCIEWKGYGKVSITISQAYLSVLKVGKTKTKSYLTIDFKANKLGNRNKNAHLLVHAQCVCF